MSRYDRQKMQKWWQQESMGNAKVAIIGAGDLGFFCALPLCCMGIGDVTLFDTRTVKDATYPLGGKTGEPEARAIADYLIQINPEIRVQGKTVKIDQFSTSNLAPYEALIDCSNSQKTTDTVYEYAMKNNKPLLSMRRTPGGGELAATPNKTTAPPSAEKDPATAMILGGAAAEEIRKHFNPMSPDETVLGEVIQYDQHHPDRFYKGQRKATRPAGAFDPGDASVAVIGAGGTGCFTILGLVTLGVKTLFQYDNDMVEATNLNRQFLHYDQVHKYKTDSIVAKLAPYAKGTLTGKTVRIVEQNIQQELGKPSYLIDCVDNNQTRTVMNQHSQTNQIPFIKMGVTTKLAEVITIVPRATPCLNCYLDIHNQPEARPVHCTEQKEPSVVTTNQIAAGIALKEFENLVRGQAPLLGVIKYSSTAPARFYTDRPTLSNCSCGYAGPYSGG